jgi:ribosomal protein L6P/L9E
MGKKGIVGTYRDRSAHQIVLKGKVSLYMFLGITKAFRSFLEISYNHFKLLF